MTGHTSDETLDGAQEQRGTDSTSATKMPNADRGVVQDSPGSPDLGFAHDNGGQGNLTSAEIDAPEREVPEDTGAVDNADR